MKRLEKENGKEELFIWRINRRRKKYIRGIVWKSARKYRRDNYKRNQVESVSIFDEKLDQRLLMVEDEYSFVDRILTSDYAKSEITLKAYTFEEQESIVNALDSIANESGIKKYIEQLTFKEKLVVFLLYVKGYKVNEVAKLLNIDRKTVYYRDFCIKQKIKTIKEIMKYGK